MSEAEELTSAMRELPGGVCAPEGFRAAGVSCGLKSSGEPDLCLLVAEERCIAAGTFTRNAFRAAPVLVTMEHLWEDGRLQAVVANSGNANAWTGERGMRDAAGMAALVARETGVSPRDVGVASTGIIGAFLDMEKVEKGIAEAARRLSREGGGEAARAIMTTDTRPKEAAVALEGFTVGGMAKGAGMIRPDMATMLAFLTTDAQVSSEELVRALRSAVERTFNRITVDGCTSTNDMVLVLASGRSGRRVGEREMEAALRTVCSRLARAIVEDGEGATRFVSVRVRGAADEEEARRAAFAVADSPLVKTAFFGGDANWGRVVQALGAALPDLEAGGVRVEIGGVTVAERGLPAEADRDLLREVMSARELWVDILLGRGDGSCEVWTCDLSYDYVRINAEYHS